MRTPSNPWLLCGRKICVAVNPWCLMHQLISPDVLVHWFSYGVVLSCSMSRLKWYLPRTNAQSISSKFPCPWERIRLVSWLLWWKDWMDAQVQIQRYFHIEWSTCNVHNSPRISGQGFYSLLSENAMHWVEGLKELQKCSVRVG